MSVQKLISVLKIFIFAILLTASSKVFAQAELQCEPVPNCEDLGYQQEVECPNGAYVACPFDASYKKCVNKSCADLGFSTTDKSRWCKTIVPCPTDLAYTLCAELDPCASYNLTFDQSLTYDPHCYHCTVCNSGSGDRYKCDVQLQQDYVILDGVCTFDPCNGQMKDDIYDFVFVQNVVPSVNPGSLHFNLNHCFDCTSCTKQDGTKMWTCVQDVEDGYFLRGDMGEISEGHSVASVFSGNGSDGSPVFSLDYSVIPTYEACLQDPTISVGGNFGLPSFTPTDPQQVLERCSLMFATTECRLDACRDYRLPENLAVGDAANCYDCTQCSTTDTSQAPLYAGYWKCEVNEKNDYRLIDGECLQDPCPGFNVTQAEYETKYGSENGQHCYDCSKCNNEDSNHNGNWKCTVKQNIESPYSLNATGECVSDPCAGYDLTQQQKNTFLNQGENSHCYSCNRCTIRSSAYYNKWKCSPKDPVDEHYHLVGDVCEPDPCLGYDISPADFPSYNTTQNKKCFQYTQCQDPSSDFYGYYKQETRSPLTWGYYIEDGQCLKDPCYDDYDISSSQLRNYDEHCYNCERCPYSPSGKLTNYYKCEASVDLGYELVNGSCLMQPCADYTYTETEKAAYIRDLGPYAEMCVEFEKCNDPNAPDEFKNNYKVTFLSIQENGYTWHINDQNECVLCDPGYLCRERDPGPVACTSGNAEFYEYCDVTEYCFNNQDVTAPNEHFHLSACSQGTGRCYAPKQGTASISNGANYWQTHFSCKTVNLKTIQFYQFLSQTDCRPDCECNCNPIYNTIKCKNANDTASYCFGTDSNGFSCNAMSDPGCTPTKIGSYYYCDTCNDTYQCELINSTYYDDDGEVVPSLSGCAINLLPENHCAASSPAPSNCTWRISSSVQQRGLYFVKDVCTNSEINKKIVYTASCTQKANDCEGGIPPAYNRKTNRAMETCLSTKKPYTYAYDSNGELLRDEDGNLVKLYGDDANPVYCGGYTYYDGCDDPTSCEETCKYSKEPPYTSYNKCDYWSLNRGTTPTSTTHKGQEPYMKKCEQVCSNKDIWYFSKCWGLETDKDCSGNAPVAAGLLENPCPTGYKPGGRTVECGGNIYAERCIQECNYNDTAESCTALGLCFEEKCRNEQGQVFGQCVDC